HARIDDSARGVDVERDLLVGVLGLEVDDLRNDQIRDLVVDRRAEEDDSLAEQAGVDVEAPLAAGTLLDNHRDHRHLKTSSDVMQPLGCGNYGSISNREVARSDCAG